MSNYPVSMDHPPALLFQARVDIATESIRIDIPATALSFFAANSGMLQSATPDGNAVEYRITDPLDLAVEIAILLGEDCDGVTLISSVLSAALERLVEKQSHALVRVEAGNTKGQKG